MNRLAAQAVTERVLRSREIASVSHESIARSRELIAVSLRIAARPMRFAAFFARLPHASDATDKQLGASAERLNAAEQQRLIEREVRQTVWSDFLL